MLCSCRLSEVQLSDSSSRYRWLTSPLHIQAAVKGIGGEGGVGWVKQARNLVLLVSVLEVV